MLIRYFLVISIPAKSPVFLFIDHVETFYLQLRQALLTKLEVVVPAVYVNPRDQ
jgi:hypothetical protein